jgi:hypothetical protein
MKIKFIKRHLQYDVDDIVSNHPNAKYLVALGVAVEVKDFEVKKKNGKL